MGLTDYICYKCGHKMLDCLREKNDCPKCGAKLEKILTCFAHTGGLWGRV